MIEFWENKSKGIVKKELFSEDADKLAKDIAAEGEGFNKPAQVRKFYDEILQFHARLKADPSKFPILLPYIKMINSKVAYSYGRKLIGEKFKNFISQCITKISDKDDFEVFVNFFEAFLGYYQLYKKS